VTKKLAGVVQGSEEYWYDEQGARTQVVKRDAAGTKTELVWFLKDSEYHYDGAGVLTKTYAHANLGTPVARIERTAANGSAKFEYQFHGLASNTLAAVAPDGTVNASFSYGPFGEVIEATNAGAANDSGITAHMRRLNDKFEDDLSGLTYYGARYYDKTLIGWTQADPLYLRAPDIAKHATPRRANIGVFSLNNPLRYLDPDGLDPSNDPSFLQKPGYHLCAPAVGGGCESPEGASFTPEQVSEHKEFYESLGVRIFRGDRNPIDFAGLSAKPLSGSIVCG
jgi:RHS repeat-associated protein